MIPHDRKNYFSHADSFKTGSFRLWADGTLSVTEARQWDPAAETLPALTIQPASAIKADGGHLPPPPQLGSTIDLSKYSTDRLGNVDNALAGPLVPATTRPHAHAGPELQALLDRQQKEVDAEIQRAQESQQERKAAAEKQKAHVAAAKAAARVNNRLGASGQPTKVHFAAKKTVPGSAAKNAATPAKVKLAAGAAKAAAPKQKPAVVEVDVVKVAESGGLSKLTVPQLKAFCRTVKLAVGGKKGDLEERVKEYLAKQGVGGNQAATEA